MKGGTSAVKGLQAGGEMQSPGNRETTGYPDTGGGSGHARGIQKCSMKGGGEEGRWLFVDEDLVERTSDFAHCNFLDLISI